MRKRLSAAYTPEEPPARGVARKIWQALEEASLIPLSLHYNANCWGQGRQDGWGTWACEIAEGEFHCGWDDVRQQAYLRILSAPFTFYWVAKP